MANEKPGGHGERSVGCRRDRHCDLGCPSPRAKARAAVELRPDCRTATNGGPYDDRHGFLLPRRAVTTIPARIWKVFRTKKHYLGTRLLLLEYEIGAGVPLAEDLKRIEAVEDVGKGSAWPVDVNGNFYLTTAIESHGDRANGLRGTRSARSSRLSSRTQLSPTDTASRVADRSRPVSLCRTRAILSPLRAAARP